MQRRKFNRCARFATSRWNSIWSATAAQIESRHRWWKVQTRNSCVVRWEYQIRKIDSESFVWRFSHNDWTCSCFVTANESWNVFNLIQWNENFNATHAKLIQLGTTTCSAITFDGKLCSHNKSDRGMKNKMKIPVERRDSIIGGIVNWPRKVGSERLWSEMLIYILGHRRLELSQAAA